MTHDPFNVPTFVCTMAQLVSVYFFICPTCFNELGTDIQIFFLLFPARTYSVVYRLIVKNKLYCPLFLFSGKYVGNRPIKLRKSTWKDRSIDVVRKKEKEKKRLGLR